MNDRVDKLDDQEMCHLEAVLEHITQPPEGKKAKRVKLVGDHRTYYTMRAMELAKPGDKLYLTIKASAFQDSIFLWIDDWTRIQKEELPLF